MGFFDKKDAKADKVKQDRTPKVELVSKLRDVKAKFKEATPVRGEQSKEDVEVRPWKAPYPTTGLVLVSATKDIPSMRTEAGPVRAGQVFVCTAEYAHANYMHLRKA